jgi:hypothetical protein
MLPYTKVVRRRCTFLAWQLANMRFVLVRTAAGGDVTMCSAKAGRSTRGHEDTKVQLV